MGLFRSFWHGGALSPYEWLCLDSFVRHDHQVVLYSFERIDVPQGVTLLDAADVLPESEFFTYDERSGAGKYSPSAFSNRFRYELLHRYGDWWIDTDVICLRDDLPEAELAFAYEDEHTMNGAVLRAPPGHPFVGALLAEAQRLGKNIVWGQVGPQLITRTADRMGLTGQALQPWTFYPIHYSEALICLDPRRTEEVEERCRDSYFLHLWNEGYRRSTIRKDIAPPAGSYLDRKFSEHGVRFSSGLQYSRYEIERIMDAFAMSREVLKQRLESAEYEVSRLSKRLERMEARPLNRWLRRPLVRAWRKLLLSYRSRNGSPSLTPR